MQEPVPTVRTSYEYRFKHWVLTSQQLKQRERGGGVGSLLSESVTLYLDPKHGCPDISLQNQNPQPIVLRIRRNSSSTVPRNCLLGLNRYLWDTPPLHPTSRFFFFFNLTCSRWTSSLPSCLWSQRIFPSLPGSRLTIFLSRCKFSTLTARQPMVEFYLLTFPRFPLRKKEHKSYFGKNRTHEFRTTTLNLQFFEKISPLFGLRGQNTSKHLKTQNTSLGGRRFLRTVVIREKKDEELYVDDPVVTRPFHCFP